MKLKYLSDKIGDIKALWYRKYFVVLDARVNSITISKSLYYHIMRTERTNTDVLVFKSCDTGQYCFCMRTDFSSLWNTIANYCQLQYNSQHQKIGFRSEQPSVTTICYEYNCPMDRMVRLSVIPRKTAKGETFYEIQRPKT